MLGFRDFNFQLMPELHFFFIFLKSYDNRSSPTPRQPLWESRLSSIAISRLIDSTCVQRRTHWIETLAPSGLKPTLPASRAGVLYAITPQVEGTRKEPVKVKA